MEASTTGIISMLSGFLKSEKLAKFKALNSDGERVKFVFEEQGYYPLLQGIRKSRQDPDETKKDLKIAKALRDAGNSAFMREEDSDALDCYNQSVILAPCDPDTGVGEDLAIALANRSAVMYRQKKYTYCIADCQLAERSGYPKHLTYKILQRMGNCQAELFKITDATNSYKKAIRALEDSKLTKDQRKQMTTEIIGWIKSIQVKDGLEKALLEFTKNPGSLVPDEMKIQDLEITDPNPSCPALSSSVEIRYDSLQGRHAVAAKDIKVGEVIAKEAPIAKILYQDHALSNCTHCFKPVLIPIPCFTCSAVLFCSAKCRDLGWSSYHKYECQEVDAMSSVYSNLFLTYRMIVQKPFEFYRTDLNLEELDVKFGAEVANPKKKIMSILGGDSSDEESDSDDDESGTNDGEKKEKEVAVKENKDFVKTMYDSSDYKTASNLVTHRDESNECEQLSYAASAALLVFIMRKSKYFGAEVGAGNILSDTEVSVGRAVYHFLQVSQFNTHQISEIQEYEQKEGVKLEAIGCSINPTLALVNHSCNPNTIRLNVGVQTILIATEKIRTGQEITDCYTVRFQDTCTKARLEYLQKNYKFDCRCTPCLSDWPVWEDIRKTVAKPGREKDVDPIRKMYASLLHLTQRDLNDGFLDRIVLMWAEFYNTLEEVLHKPHKCYLKVSSQLLDCFWLKYGNRVPKLKAPVYKDFKKDAKLTDAQRAGDEN